MRPLIPENNKLIHEAKKNPKAFGKIYNQYVAGIYRYIFSRVGRQKEVAEDISQETFLKALKSRERFEERGIPYFAYLKRIAHNLLINYYRTKKDLPIEEAGDIADEGADRRFLASETIKEFEEIIAVLPEAHREIIVLRYQEELPIKEIAKRVNKSENAVKLILSRARKSLARVNQPTIKKKKTK